MTKVDLDTQLVERALKVAGLELVKRGGAPSIGLAMDLAQAIRAVIGEKYEDDRLRRAREFEAIMGVSEQWFKSPQWTPAEIDTMKQRGVKIEPKGPRPYHTGRMTRPLAPISEAHAVEWEKASRVLYGNTRVVGIDPGKVGSDSSCIAEIGKDGEILSITTLEHKSETGDDHTAQRSVDDHAGREAERKKDAARIAAVMGWKD